VAGDQGIQQTGTNEGVDMNWAAFVWSLVSFAGIGLLLVASMLFEKGYNKLGAGCLVALALFVSVAIGLAVH
jgi:hypothetical protein